MDTGTLFKVVGNFSNNHTKKCGRYMGKEVVKAVCQLLNFEPHHIDRILTAYDWKGVHARTRIKLSEARRRLNLTASQWNYRHTNNPDYSWVKVFRDTRCSSYVYEDEIDHLIAKLEESTRVLGGN